MAQASARSGVHKTQGQAGASKVKDDQQETISNIDDDSMLMYTRQMNDTKQTHKVVL